MKTPAQYAASLMRDSLRWTDPGSRTIKQIAEFATCLKLLQVKEFSQENFLEIRRRLARAGWEVSPPSEKAAP